MIKVVDLESNSSAFDSIQVNAECNVHCCFGVGCLSLEADFVIKVVDLDSNSSIFDLMQ